MGVKSEKEFRDNLAGMLEGGDEEWPEAILKLNSNTKFTRKQLMKIKRYYAKRIEEGVFTPDFDFDAVCAYIKDNIRSCSRNITLIGNYSEKAAYTMAGVKQQVRYNYANTGTLEDYINMKFNMGGISEYGKRIGDEGIENNMNWLKINTKNWGGK